MLMGTGVFVENEVTIYLPRYLDWSVTTPILLTGLILTGLHEHPRHPTYVLPAIVLDAIMIATGLLAALTEIRARSWSGSHGPAPHSSAPSTSCGDRFLPSATGSAGRSRRSIARTSSS